MSIIIIIEPPNFDCAMTQYSGQSWHNWTPNEVLIVLPVDQTPPPIRRIYVMHHSSIDTDTKITAHQHTTCASVHIRAPYVFLQWPSAKTRNDLQKIEKSWHILGQGHRLFTYAYQTRRRLALSDKQAGSCDEHSVINHRILPVKRFGEHTRRRDVIIASCVARYTIM